MIIVPGGKICPILFKSWSLEVQSSVTEHETQKSTTCICRAVLIPREIEFVIAACDDFSTQIALILPSVYFTNSLTLFSSRHFCFSNTLSRNLSFPILQYSIISILE